MNIIDMHCDTLSALLEYKRKGHSSELRKQDTQIEMCIRDRYMPAAHHVPLLWNPGSVDNISSSLPEKVPRILRSLSHHNAYILSMILMDDNCKSCRFDPSEGNSSVPDGSDKC